ncbi:hypothetical protein RIF29_40040 [Crotalaria pallida]|uniref:Uncharacterized protein n=1 Tax=Crotalaria pallida TaxID=3830 RepID=A0AAN9HN30_CROPI
MFWRYPHSGVELLLASQVYMNGGPLLYCGVFRICCKLIFIILQSLSAKTLELSKQERVQFHKADPRLAKDTYQTIYSRTH